MGASSRPTRVVPRARTRVLWTLTSARCTYAAYGCAQADDVTRCHYTYGHSYFR